MATIHVIGSRGIPATWGGVERQCEELYYRLAKKGHRIVIFARTGYIKTPIKQYKGVHIIRLPTLPLKGFEAAIHTLFSTLVSLLLKPEIVHYYSQGPCLFSWLPRLYSPRTRIFFTCGGLDWQRQKWNRVESIIIKLGEIFSAKFPHYIIVVSKELKKYYENRYKRKVYHIPNGVNIPTLAVDQDLESLKRFELTPKEYLLSVSRIVPEKRVEDMIEAFKIANVKYPLVVVGDTGGHSNDYISYLKEKAKGDPLIRFVGFQFGKDLDMLFRNARFFVTSSELEGLPITLLEAMSYGLPCIASDIPPHREVLGDAAGLFFKVGDTQALAHKMKLLEIADTAFLRQLGEITMKRVRENFSWDDIVDQLEQLYEQSLRSRS